MKITSTGIKNGYFKPIYGGNGDLINENGMPTYSIPFTIHEAPANTVSYAAIFYDLDAYEVTKGFPWIHWTLANLTTTEVLENSSQQTPDFVQGVNTWHSPMTDNQSAELSAHYGGMNPPNRDHRYTLKVYALDTALALTDGFYLNQLTDAIEGHVLATATLAANYRQAQG